MPPSCCEVSGPFIVGLASPHSALTCQCRGRGCAHASFEAGKEDKARWEAKKGNARGLRPAFAKASVKREMRPAKSQSRLIRASRLFLRFAGLVFLLDAQLKCLQGSARPFYSRLTAKRTETEQPPSHGTSVAMFNITDTKPSASNPLLQHQPAPQL